MREKIQTGKVKILISAENSKEIEEFLEEDGYKKEEDFLQLDQIYMKKYVEEFIRPYTRDVLIMGDCEFSKISLEDTDMRNLAEMLKTNWESAGQKFWLCMEWDYDRIIICCIRRLPWG